MPQVRVAHHARVGQQVALSINILADIEAENGAALARIDEEEHVEEQLPELHLRSGLLLDGGVTEAEQVEVLRQLVEQHHRYEHQDRADSDDEILLVVGDSSDAV